MAGLQFREKEVRSKLTMQIRTHGQPIPIADRIARGFKRSRVAGVDEDNSVQKSLKTKLQSALEQIEHRLPLEIKDKPKNTDDAFASVGRETLHILDETGPWVTQAVGGDEVNVVMGVAERDLAARARSEEQDRFKREVERANKEASQKQMELDNARQEKSELEE